MPAWIHDRADHIQSKNPSMPKSEAFAIATQQSHALGKSPKGYGTSKGREEAKNKYKTPGDDVKTAMDPMLMSSLRSVAGTGPALRGQLTNVGQNLMGGAAGQVKSMARKGTRLQNAPAPRPMIRPLAIEADPFAKAAMMQAFSDEFMKIAEDAEEKNKNLKKYMTGAGIELGGMAGAGGLGSLSGVLGKREAEHPASPALYRTLKSRSPVPIEENDLGVGGSMYHFEAPDSPAKIQVGLQSPSILGHELGHAAIGGNRLGKLLQNKVTFTLGRNANLVGAGAGLASGLSSDDEKVHRRALLAPAISSLPLLAAEGGASLHALKNLRSGGARGGSLLRAAGTLAPAFGSYLAQTGSGVGSAIGGQAIGSAIRGGLKKHDEKKKTAQEKDSGFMDSLKGALTTPIPGTPELFGGAKGAIEKATRGGASGKGPSAGFLKFQQQLHKNAGMWDRMSGALSAVNRGGSFVGGGGGAPSQGFQNFQQQGAAPKPAVATPPAAQAGAPRALPPMNQPLNPGGMNMLFAPRSRGGFQPAPVGVR
jgi:hypothetical protein